MTSSVAERQDNVERCLRTVGATYGRITASQLGKRHAWAPRSVSRYLESLETKGLIEAIGRAPGKECAWKITAEGKTYLQSVTSGDERARFGSHPATQERDSDHGN